MEVFTGEGKLVRNPSLFLLREIAGRSRQTNLLAVRLSSRLHLRQVRREVHAGRAAVLDTALENVTMDEVVQKLTQRAGFSTD